MSSKLINSLSTLSSKEWSSFRKFLLMNTRDDSDNFKIFKFIQLRKDGMDVLENLDTLRMKYFPKFTGKGFSNVMSRLQLWLEEWMVIEEMRSIKYEKELLLVKATNRRGLYDQADQTARKVNELPRSKLTGYHSPANQ